MDLLTAWQTHVPGAPALLPALEGVSAALLNPRKQRLHMGLCLQDQIHGVTPEEYL